MLIQTDARVDDNTPEPHRIDLRHFPPEGAERECTEEGSAPLILSLVCF